MGATVVDFGRHDFNEERIDATRQRVAPVPVLEPDVGEYLDIGVEQEELLLNEAALRMDDDEYGMG